MKTIEHVTNIAAPADAVWGVLTDTDHYADWNPFLDIEQTPAAVGQKLSITIRPARRTITFRPVVTTYTAGHEISWLGHFLVPDCSTAPTPCPSGSFPTARRPSHSARRFGACSSG